MSCSPRRRKMALPRWAMEERHDMTDHAHLEEQTERDFGHARRKAFYRRLFRRVSARMRSGVSSGRLFSFEEAKGEAGARCAVHRGREIVPLGLIVGTVSRNSDFDGEFLPRDSSVGERWKSVDRVFLRKRKLPPVSLYKVGGAYFVLDGCHRVSVARYHGAKKIEAEVTEFFSARPSRPPALEKELG